MNSVQAFSLYSISAAWLAIAPSNTSAKPPAKATLSSNPASTPAPAAKVLSTDPSAIDPLAHWLVEQNGSPGSIAMPFSQVVKALTDKTVFPLNLADVRDAAVIAKIGSALDSILPRMNRPDSPAHIAARDNSFQEVAARFEDELSVLLRGTPAPAAAGPAESPAPRAANRDSAYPALQFADATTGKAYYVSVALYPTGERDAITRSLSAARALTLHPIDSARRITTDGCCLLVGIEHDGKFGPGMAFLNWEIIDLAKLPLHLTATVEANGGELHRPGAVVTDGRKGRD